MLSFSSAIRRMPAGRARIGWRGVVAVRGRFIKPRSIGYGRWGVGAQRRKRLVEKSVNHSGHPAPAQGAWNLVAVEVEAG
jgi:hypothetical protein